MKSLELTEIDKTHLSFAKNNNKSIIIAEIPLLVKTPNIIIDRNYRLKSKYKAQESIEAYQLPTEIHIECMADKLSQLIYAAHYNLYYILTNCENRTLFDLNKISKENIFTNIKNK